MTKEELLKRTLEDLGKQYPVGLYKYLYEYCPATYNAILRAENETDRAFLSGTVEKLKTALREYWRLHMEGIRQFKQSGTCFNQTLTAQKIQQRR